MFLLEGTETALPTQKAGLHGALAGVAPLRSVVRFARRACQRAGCRRRTVLGLGRRTPVSRAFGWDRGTPIDRVHIERFLERHSADIRGTVLEIEDPAYTRAGCDDSWLLAASGWAMARRVGLCAVRLEWRGPRGSC